MIERLLFFRRKAPLHYPMGHAPRTAVLGPWFRETRRPGPVRVFNEWGERAAAFKPAALVGNLPQLLDLARSNPPVLTHALIIVGSPGEPLPGLGERDELWRVFQVPVFAQIIGEQGELLAAECEAHDGMHIESERLEANKYRLENAACACGRKAPRIHEAVERGLAAGHR